MRREILLLTCFFAMVNFTLADKCSDQINNLSCDFYTQCLETKYKCGPTGYPVGYGFKYCSKFIKNIAEYPPKGQEWIKKTLVCLKKALLPEFQSCSTLYDAAFDSHPRCYYESGFCDMFIDQGNLRKTVSALLNTYEIKDFASITSLKQIFDTAKLCGADYLKKIMDSIKDIFGNKFLELTMLEEQY
jgi:hypothetical protein